MLWEYESKQEADKNGLLERLTVPLGVTYMRTHVAFPTGL